MIIFLHGEDIYRLLQSRDEIVQKYQAKHGSGFNIFRIEGGSATAAADVAEAIKSISLFSEVKLILISNVFSNSQTAKDLQELFTAYRITEDKGIVVLATHSGTVAQAKPKELFSFLSDTKNLAREFNPLQGLQLHAWLKKEALKRGATFGPAALTRFVAATGPATAGDSWTLINNLDKLANYTQGIITVVDIDLLIKTESEPNVFEFIDALGSGRKAQAFSLLSGELAYGRDPYYLLSMVMYQFRNMLMVKDFADRNIPPAQIAQKAGIHPFVVKKMLSAVANLTLTDIKRLYQEVLDLEQGTKQGRRDLEDGLFTLALS